MSKNTKSDLPAGESAYGNDNNPKTHKSLHKSNKDKKNGSKIKDKKEKKKKEKVFAPM